VSLSICQVEITDCGVEESEEDEEEDDEDDE